MSENNVEDKISSMGMNIYKMGLKDGKSEKAKPRSDNAKKLDKLTDKVVADLAEGKEPASFDNIRKACGGIAMGSSDDVSRTNIENTIKLLANYLLSMPQPQPKKQVQKITN